MGVRVRVVLSAAGRDPTETTALCSSGFETSRCEVLLPAVLAAKLGLSARSPRAHVDRYVGPAGAAKMLSVPDAVRVRLARASSPDVLCDVAVSDREEEVMLADATIDALGIELARAGAGVWRLRGSAETRESDPAECWPSVRRRRRRRR